MILYTAFEIESHTQSSFQLLEQYQASNWYLHWHKFTLKK